jgi:membrane protein implicated in regulation of membrane protease activity
MGISDWLTPALIWFVLGLILILIEFIIPGLVTIFFGIGAWVVALLCLIFEISLNMQLFIFIVISILLLVFLRKWFQSIFYNRSIASPVNMEELEEYLGKKAVVVEEIAAANQGKVEFRGSTWKAEGYETIPIGTTVEIIDKNNITLIVKPLDFCNFCNLLINSWLHC